MGIDAEILVRVPRKVGDQECRIVGNHLCEMFGPEKFFFREASEWEPRADLHVIFPVERWEQDGPDIEPNPGETFLQVSVWSRYYGEGYERGDWPFLFLLMEALEVLIPGCSVWYGGDSSGICAEPYGPAKRRKLLAHFFKVRHEPYEGAWGSLADKGQGGFDCSLCQLPMRQYGFGGNYRGFRCACGEKIEERSGVVTRITGRQAREESIKGHA